MNPVRLRGSAIEKRYGRVAALRGVDFEIAAGESVAVLGANGAGKSSLLRILAGLSRPSQGRLEVFAETASSTPTTHRDSESGAARTPEALSQDALRAAVGYVGHATLLYGDLTARENLDFAARLHGRRPTRDEVDALLGRLRLLDVADRKAGGFSRGMSQRLSIARAVVHGPALLLLDEPFTGLDEGSMENLTAELAAERAEGRSLVLVTHDPARATALTDRALVLAKGQLRATPRRGDTEAEVAFETEALRDLLARLGREVAGDQTPAQGAHP